MLPSTVAPYFTFNNSTYCFTLNADKAGYDIKSGDYISIYCNSAAYRLFDSADSKYYGVNVTDGKNYQLLAYDQNGTNWNVISAVTYYQMQQAYPSTPLWNPVKSIVFQSSTLPLNADLQGAPIIFNNDDGITVGGNNNNISLVLTDFVVGLSKGYEYKPNILYSPNIYRMIDLFGNSDLSQMDMQVYWTDTLGRQFPLTLSPGSSCQIKIMFRRKTLAV